MESPNILEREEEAGGIQLSQCDSSSETKEKTFGGATQLSATII